MAIKRPAPPLNRRRRLKEATKEEEEEEAQAPMDSVGQCGVVNL